MADFICQYIWQFYFYYRKSIILYLSSNIILPFTFEPSHRSLYEHIALSRQKRKIACNFFLGGMVAEMDELFAGTRKNFQTCGNSIVQTAI